MCQRIQYFANIIFLCSGITFCKALGNTVVAGIKHHLGTGLSIKNLNITADNVTRCSIIMLIPYLGNTFGIGNMNRIIIVYSDDTGRCFILTAYKAAQMRNAIIFFIVRPAVISKIACIKAILTGSIFINPLRAVLQPQIYFTGLFSTGIVNYTLPGGILRGQADVKATVLINHSLSGLIRGLHCQHVADHFYLAVLCFLILYIYVNRAAVACQSIVRLDKFAEAFNKVFFSVRCVDTDRITQQRNSSQIISRYITVSLINIGSYSCTAYSKIHITVDSDITAAMVNGNTCRLPTGACIVGIATHAGCTAGAYIAMNILGNDTPRIFCIILTHLYVAVDNQVTLIGCRNTDRRICRGGSDIQITVDNNSTLVSRKTIYTGPGITLIICLINMDRAIAAICAYVIINAVFAGSNTILIGNSKGMVLSLEIIDKFTVIFCYGITIGTQYLAVLFKRTYERLAVISGINRCYEKARCTGCEKNT